MSILIIIGCIRFHIGAKLTLEIGATDEQNNLNFSQTELLLQLFKNSIITFSGPSKSRN